MTANLKAITGYAAKHEAQFAKLLMAQSEDGGKKKNAARRLSWTPPRSASPS